METDAVSKAEMLATASRLDSLDAESRALHAEVKAAKARAAALEPGPARLVAHFALLAALSLLSSFFILRWSVGSWGASTYVLPACGVLVGVVLFVAALYVLSKATSPQPERLRFARVLPRGLAPVRPSLLVTLYALALLVGVALMRPGHGS
jgi:hypothetical protein